MVKEKVIKHPIELPDPVTAQAQISRPRSARGTVAAWIGVGECKPIAERALNNEKNVINKKKNKFVIL